MLENDLPLKPWNSIITPSCKQMFLLTNYSTAVHPTKSMLKFNAGSLETPMPATVYSKATSSISKDDQKLKI